MKIVSVDGLDRLILEKGKDVCPVCGVKIEHIGWSWNMFHGEASASCCGASYQIKSYSAGDDGTDEAKAFTDSLDTPGVYWFKHSATQARVFKAFMKEKNRDFIYDADYEAINLRIKAALEKEGDPLTWAEYFGGGGNHDNR